MAGKIRMRRRSREPGWWALTPSVAPRRIPLPQNCLGEGELAWIGLLRTGVVRARLIAPTLRPGSTPAHAHQSRRGRPAWLPVPGAGRTPRYPGSTAALHEMASAVFAWFQPGASAPGVPAPGDAAPHDHPRPNPPSPPPNSKAPPFTGGASRGVPGAGLEPASRWAGHFKCPVFTDFTTRAGPKIIRTPHPVECPVQRVPSASSIAARRRATFSATVARALYTADPATTAVAPARTTSPTVSAVTPPSTSSST